MSLLGWFVGTTLEPTKPKPRHELPIHVTCAAMKWRYQSDERRQIHSYTLIESHTRTMIGNMEKKEIEKCIHI